MLKAAVARCAITPLNGMIMIGYASREGVAQGKDGELYATALALDDERTRIVILSFDLVSIQEPLASALRKEIGERLGIPSTHVLMNCSHTHCGPALQKFQYDVEDETQDRLLQAYATRFGTEIPLLAESAARHLSPARLGTGVGEARIGINRRELQADGSIVLGENPSCPVDHEVRVIRIDDLEGRPIAVVYAHGCHTVTMGPKNLRWSADYIGPAREVIEENTGALSLYLQANAGDVNPISGIGTKEDNSNEKKRLGLTLGGEVLKVHSSIYTESVRGPRSYMASLAKIPFYPRVKFEREPDYTIAVKESKVELPLHDLPSREEASEILRQYQADADGLVKEKAREGQIQVARRYLHWATALLAHITSGRKPAVDVTVQAIKIGDLAIVAVSGETFHRLGLEVKRQSPFRNTLFLGYSNGCLCYIPTPDAYPKGGWSIRERYYVPDMIFQAYLIPMALRPDCGEIVVNKSLELLGQLRS